MTFRRRPWIVVVFLAWNAGCGVPTRTFRGVNDPAPVVRARAVLFADGLPETAVIPSLIARLSDPDAVVRMMANEELKQGTGQDFGFVPWADRPERDQAAGRWRDWWNDREAGLAKLRKTH